MNKTKYTFKYGDVVLKESFNIPLNLNIYQQVEKDGVKYIVIKILVELPSCEHIIYLTKLSEFKLQQTEKNKKKNKKEVAKDFSNEFNFEIQYRERDPFTKKFGDWLTFKTFTNELERNSFFKNMVKEKDKVYKIYRRLPNH